MANILATLGLEIDASGALRGLRDVDTATNRTSRNVSELTRLARNLGLAFGAYELVQWTRETIELADAYTTMQSRLALVTRDAGNLAQVQRDLFGIAQEARTPLESTALLYERLARVSGELGLSQAELLRHTETINKAMVISGTSAEGTRAALIQLSQGFAAGTLRGDELNAVLEQAPRLAQAIADGMGVSVGMLRRMGAEGKLTADAIVDALEDQADAIDREFSGMEMTVSGAMTRLRNVWMVYVGETNEAAGATSGLAEAINSLADAIEPAGEKVNAFFGGIALLAVDAAVELRKLQHTIVNMAPDWLVSENFTKAAKSMPGPFGTSAAVSIENLRYLRGVDQETFFAELEAYREEQEARITGVGARPSGRVYGAGLTDDEGTPNPLSREEERRIEAYQRLRQEMQYAREDAQQEALDLGRSTLAREYARNALEHERRVRDIMANQAPEYREELIRESEALLAADNARAQRIDRFEREEELLKSLVAADREATAALVAQEEERRQAMERPFENAIENIQRGWGEMFDDVLEHGRLTARDLGALFRRTAGELAAGVAMSRMQGALAGWFGLGDDDDPSLGATMNREAAKGALAGAAVGYGVGQSTQSGAGGFVTGAVGGAAAGWMAGGPIGAAVGGLAGAVSGLIGGLNGAAEASRQWDRALEDLERSVERMRAEVAGDALREQTAAVEEWADAARRALEDLYRGANFAQGIGLENAQAGEYQRRLAEINALEAERIAQLQEEAAAMRDDLADSLAVRTLAAQGRTEEARALRLQLDQQEELDRYRKAFEADGLDAQEAALLAQLEYVHALERTAEAMSGLNREALNLPATFKMAGYVFDAMQEMTADQYRRAVFGGGPTPMPSAPPSQIPAGPFTGAPAGSGGMIMVSPDQPFVVQLSNGKEIARFTLGEFKRGAAGPGKEQTARILSDITVN